MRRKGTHHKGHLGDGQLGAKKHGLRHNLSVAAALLAVLGLAVSSQVNTPGGNQDGAQKDVHSDLFAGQVLTAQFAKKHGFLDQAAPLYQQLSQELQADVTLTNQSYYTLLIMGKFDEALSLVHRHVATETLDSTAQLLVILEQIKQGNFSGAKEAISHFIPGETRGLQQSIPHEQPELLSEIVIPMLNVWLQAHDGQPDAAREALYAIDHPYMQPFLATQEALLALHQGDNDTAQARLQAWQQQNKTDIMTPIMQTLQQRLAAGANKDNDTTLTDPAHRAADVLAAMGWHYLKEAEWELSVRYFRLAEFLDDSRPDLTMLLAGALNEQGYSEISQQVLATIPATSDDYPKAQRMMAVALFDDGQRDEAITMMTQFLTAHPEALDHRLQLADFLMKTQKYADAINHYTQVLDAQPKILPEHWAIYYVRGIAYEQTHQRDLAEADLLKALDLSPNQPDVLNYLGYSWLEQGRNLHDAHRLLKQAVEQRPNDPHFLDSYGWALYKLGEFDRAEPFLELAVQMLPYDVVVNHHLGDIYWRNGRLVEARYQWQRALTYTPESQEEIAVLQQKLVDGLPPEGLTPPVVAQPMRPDDASQAGQSTTPSKTVPQ